MSNDRKRIDMLCNFGLSAHLLSCSLTRSRSGVRFTGVIDFMVWEITSEGLGEVGEI